MRAILIDPARLSVGYVECSGSLDELQATVGGYLEFAHEFPNGDTLYVDEDGLLKPAASFSGHANAFAIMAHQPFRGRGFIVGPEDDAGKPTDVRSTVPEIKLRLAFGNI